MKVKFSLFVIVSCIIGSFNCKDSIDIIQPITESRDTLETILSPGVVMKLSGIRDSYSVNDTLLGKITLTNTNDTNSFKVIFPIWPGWQLNVFDESSKFVGGGPDVISFTEIRYTLTKGQSYYYDTYWSMGTFGKVPGYVVLPAFPGQYRLRFRLSGNSSMFDKYLTKWITIESSGPPSCFFLKNTYDQFTLAILNFAVRNRFSNALTYTFQGNPSAEFTVLSIPTGQDTLFRDTLHFSNNQIVIPGRSDSLLFSYRFDKSRPALLALNGTYKIQVHLRFIEQDIYSDDFIYFVPPPTEKSNANIRKRN